MMRLRSKLAFAAARRDMLATLERYLADRVEVGLADVKRMLAGVHSADEDMANDGPVVSRMLSTLGWERGGTLYRGYDATPRYVPRDRP